MGATADETTTVTGAKRRRRWPRVLLAAVVLLLLVPVLAFLLLQTPWAKNRLGREVATRLSAATGYTITIDGVSGRLPWSLGIDEISLADTDGVWLVLRDVELDAQPMEWVRERRYHITDLRAGELDWRRKPLPSSQPEEPSADSSAGPPSLPPIQIDALAVRRLVLGEALVGEELDGEFSGSLSAGGPGTESAIRAQLDLSLGDGVASGSADIDLNLAAELADSNTTFQVHWQERQPVLLALTGRPELTELAPLSLDVNGQGTSSNLPVTITITGADRELLAGDAHWRRLPTGARHLTGTLTADSASLPLPEALATRIQGDLDIDMDLRQDADGLIKIDLLDVSDERQVVSFYGQLRRDLSLVDLTVDAELDEVAELGIPALEGLSGDASIHLALVKGLAEDPLGRASTDISGNLRYRDWQVDGLQLNATARRRTDRPWVGLVEELDAAAVSFRIQADAVANTAEPLPLPVEQVDLRLGSLKQEAGSWKAGEIDLRTSILQAQSSELTYATEAQQLTGDIALTIESLEALPPARDQGLAGSLRLKANVEYGLPQQDLQASVEAAGTAVRVTLPAPEADAASEPLQVPDFIIDGRVHWRGEAKTLSWQDSHLQVADARLSTQGELDLTANTGRAAYELDMASMTLLQSLDNARGQAGDPDYRTPLQSGQLQAKGDAELRQDELTLGVAWRLREFAVPQGGLADATGDWTVTAVTDEAGERRLSLAAKGAVTDLSVSAVETMPVDDFRYDTTLSTTVGGPVAIDALTLTTDLAILTVAGQVDPGARTMDLKGRFHGDDIEPLAAAFDQQAAGDFDLTYTAAGEFTAPTLTATLRSKTFETRGYAFADVAAEISAAPQDQNWAGQADLAATWREVPLTLAGDWRFGQSSVSLAGMTANGLETTVSGEIGFSLETKLATGDLTLEARDLSKWNSQLPIDDLAGSLAGRILLTGAGGKQNAGVDLTATDLASQGVRVGQLTVVGEVSDVLGEAAGKLDVTVTDGTRKSLIVDNATLTVAGDRAALDFDLDVAGSYDEKLAEASAAGQLRELSSLELTELTIDAGEEPTTLLAPTTISREGETIRWQSTRLRIGRGTVVSAGSYSPDALDASLELEAMPLTSDQADGSLTGRLHLAGTPQAPQVDGSVDVKDLIFYDDLPADEGRAKLFHGDLKLVAKSVPDGLNLDLRVVGRGKGAPTGSLVGDLPLEFTLQPLHVELRQETPLEIDGDLNAEIGLLSRYLLPDGHYLRGRMQADLQIVGTVKTPAVAGHVRMEKGRYENAFTGTVLRDFSFEVIGENDRLELRRLAATDGDDGRLEGQGHLQLDREGTLPFELKLTLTNFTTVRYDHAVASADGELTLAGTRQRKKLSGTLQITQAETAIPDAGIKIVDVPVIETRDGELLNPLPAQDPGVEADGGRRKRTRPIRLDLTARSDGKFFLRGRGINSEWRGELKISGSGSRPKLVGRLDLVRGTYIVSGRRLELTEGRITFNGSSPPAPRIDLVAEARAGTLTALITLRGPLDSPTLELSSRPPRSKEEIISQLFLRRGTGNISVSQALAIANLAESLTTGTNALDVVSRLRQLTGLDRLDLAPGSEEDAGDSVRAGKYLADRVYVEYERSLDLQSDTLMIEVELNDNLGIESRVSPDGRAGVELFWKLDY